MNPLCDAISVEIEQNKRIADWARKAHKRCVEFLDEMFAQDMGFRTDETIDGIDIRKEGVKTFGGPIMSELVDRFRAKLDNKLNSSQSQWISRKKYYAYSAHDVSLSRLYAALGLDYDRIGRPELADAFLIELWMDKNDKNSTVVKVIHLRKGKEPRDISKEVSGCKDTKEGCSFEEFAARSVFAPSTGEFCDSSLPSQTKIHYKRQFYPDNGLVPRIFDTVYL
uniref:Acid phosphatase n=2 Tax=Panagrolaimus sp. JU765 TaxID=591449 RepID=A0AC34Q9R6_9BILA